MNGASLFFLENKNYACIESGVRAVSELAIIAHSLPEHPLSGRY